MTPLHSLLFASVDCAANVKAAGENEEGRLKYSLCTCARILKSTAIIVVIKQHFMHRIYDFGTDKFFTSLEGQSTKDIPRLFVLFISKQQSCCDIKIFFLNSCLCLLPCGK